MANDNQIAVKKRLIYAEDLFAPVDRKVHIIGGRNSGKTMAMYEQLFRERVAMAPTVDADPVVHAFWELYNKDSDNYWKRGWRCSHCKGYHFHNGGMIKKYKRCPNCGAHMDLKEADHD